MTDNWYIILELEFDPPVEDEQKIADKIEERKRYWSKNSTDFQRGNEYKTLLQKIPQIKKDMIGPQNKRKELAEEARKNVYGPIDGYLNDIKEKEGKITTEKGEKIAKACKVTVDIVKKRADRLGIEWKDYQTIYDQYYKTKPQKPSSYDAMASMLSSFHVDNLYDFLYTDTAVKNRNRLSCEELREKAAEKKKTFRKNDSISSNGQKLCQQCEITFKDEDSKDLYDKYLEYAKCKAVLDKAKNDAEILDELTAENFNDFVNQLNDLFRDHRLSEDLLEAFCEIEGIRYNKEAEKKSETTSKGSNTSNPTPNRPLTNPASNGSDTSSGNSDKPPIIIVNSDKEKKNGSCLKGCLISILVVVFILVIVGKIFSSIILFDKEQEKEQEKYDYEQALNELEESMKELENEDEPSETPEEESPTVEPEQENDQHGWSDEEWFLNFYGYEKDAWSYDERKVYYEAGGDLMNPVQSHLVRYLNIWAQEKGDDYWADGHIKGVSSTTFFQPTMNTRLSELNPSSILSYTREIMESSIWEELRAYVGDEEADRINQEMNELIQKEEEIIANMGQN